jgi:hypothetical protein
VNVRLLGLFVLASGTSWVAQVASALESLLLVPGLPFFDAAISAQSCLTKSFFIDVARLRIFPRWCSGMFRLSSIASNSLSISFSSRTSSGSTCGDFGFVPNADTAAITRKPRLAAVFSDLVDVDVVFLSKLGRLPPESRRIISALFLELPPLTRLLISCMLKLLGGNDVLGRCEPSSRLVRVGWEFGPS